MPLELVPLAEQFLEVYNIGIKDVQDKPEIVATILMHMDALFYNVTSVATVMAMLSGKRRVEPKHLEEVRKYIHTNCGGTSAKIGGNVTGFPAPYFGEKGPTTYSTDPNIGATNMETVKFAEGYTREDVGMVGGSHTHAVFFNNKVATKHVKKILEHHKCEISKTALPALLRMMDQHLACLAKDIGTIATFGKIKKILRYKRHSMFH